MSTRNQATAELAPPGGATRLFWLGVLLLPCSLLVIGLFRVSGQAHNLLWLGVVSQVLGCVLVLLARPNVQHLIGAPVIMLYVIALSWMLLAAQGLQDWYFHLSHAVLLVVPLAFFAWQCLRDPGAWSCAEPGTYRLSSRPDWPAELQACRALPEVKALRDSLQVDASPALNLLGHPRLKPRIAALAARKYRQSWQPGQPEMLLNIARQSSEAEIKIGVVQALANLKERLLIPSRYRSSCSILRRRCVMPPSRPCCGTRNSAGTGPAQRRAYRPGPSARPERWPVVPGGALADTQVQSPT